MRTLNRPHRSRSSITLPRPRAGGHDAVADDTPVAVLATHAPATSRDRVDAHVVAVGLAALAVATAGLTWAALSGPSTTGAVHQQVPPADNSDLNRLLDPSPVPGDPFPGRAAYDELVGTG